MTTLQRFIRLLVTHKTGDGQRMTGEFAVSSSFGKYVTVSVFLPLTDKNQTFDGILRWILFVKTLGQTSAVQVASFFFLYVKSIYVESLRTMFVF